MKKNYDDIIDLPHHVSDHHPQMSRQDRAAQFSPFAALTGYEQAVEETARRVDEKLEVGEERAQRINEGLNYLKNTVHSLPAAEITYFLKDERKQGGKYLKKVLRIAKVDEYRRMIVDTQGLKISFDDIYKIERPSQIPSEEPWETTL
ncbi:MAG: hypothetical protein IJM79_07635 [Erysipelotrichaceae bacterium]|nr:hypothetical protein [Erysipelotrichaceae bacterium]